MNLTPWWKIICILFVLSWNIVWLMTFKNNNWVQCNWRSYKRSDNYGNADSLICVVCVWRQSGRAETSTYFRKQNQLILIMDRNIWSFLWQIQYGLN
jgi:hypothetical protein